MYKVVKKLIDDALVGVDVYTKDDKIWFIFTNQKNWVFELDKKGNLYYHFYFFRDLFSYLSLDAVKNQHYITKWFEDTIQNGVKETQMIGNNREIIVVENIYNEKKNTVIDKTTVFDIVEDTIQNGVKRTFRKSFKQPESVKNTIQNGVKLNQ